MFVPAGSEGFIVDAGREIVWRSGRYCVEDEWVSVWFLREGREIGGEEFWYSEYFRMGAFSLEQAFEVFRELAEKAFEARVKKIPGPWDEKVTSACN